MISHAAVFWSKWACESCEPIGVLISHVHSWVDSREVVETVRSEALWEEVGHQWSAFDYCTLSSPPPSQLLLWEELYCHTLPLTMFYLTPGLKQPTHPNKQSRPFPLSFQTVHPTTEKLTHILGWGGRNLGRCQSKDTKFQLYKTKIQRMYYCMIHWLQLIMYFILGNWWPQIMLEFFG